jgi:23S rRNA (guanosine2251-2'-O)-methyltransferase
MSLRILILDDIRSTHNVGSILRTADGFGVSEVFFCGYTPYPTIPNDPRLPHEREKSTRAIHKTALDAEKTMPITVFTTTAEAINEARRRGYTVAALEQATDSTPLWSFNSADKLAIILGNEVTGIANDTLEMSDITLEIPMFGKKESFNVSVSAAICLYELARHTHAS